MKHYSALRRGLVTGFVGVVLIVILFSFVLPHGFRQSRQSRATQLLAELEAWKRAGGKESGLDALEQSSGQLAWTRVQRVIELQGRRFEAVIEVASREFRGRGVLLGTRDGSVIWAGHSATNLFFDSQSASSRTARPGQANGYK